MPQYVFVQALLWKMPDQTPLTLQQVTDTVAYVEGLDFDVKLKRFDRIFEVQPAVLLKKLMRRVIIATGLLLGGCKVPAVDGDRRPIALLEPQASPLE